MSKKAVNKVILLGNLGADPELRYTGTGSAVLNFSLATSKDVKTAEGKWEEAADWHKATLWGKRAVSCSKYLKKGSRVYIEGILRPSTWKDKEGVSHKGTEIKVNDIKFLGGVNRVNESETSILAN